MSQEGLETEIPYKEKLDDIYDNPEDNQKASINTELLSSALYFFMQIKYTMASALKKHKI
jgi:hypothetical protein